MTVVVRAHWESDELIAWATPLVLPMTSCSEPTGQTLMDSRNRIPSVDLASSMPLLRSSGWSGATHSAEVDGHICFKGVLVRKDAVKVA